MDTIIAAMPTQNAKMSNHPPRAETTKKNQSKKPKTPRVKLESAKVFEDDVAVTVKPAEQILGAGASLQCVLITLAVVRVHVPDCS